MTNDSRVLIREGVVTQVIPERCAVRVTFEDRDGLTSAELPILQPACFKDKFYALPDVNDVVVCLMAPNDPNGNSGWVVGSRYHDKNLPPTQDIDINRIRFADGTSITYDRADHELSINCVGDVTFNARKIILNAQKIILNEG